MIPRHPRRAPVVLTADSHSTLRPVADARISGGFWHERRRVNGEVTIPDGLRRLDESGNLHNLRLAAATVSRAAATASGPESDGGRDAAATYAGDLPFMDSDVHKWLEAASWQLAETEGAGRAGRADAPGAAELARQVDDVIALLAAAQRPDGYLDTYFQVARPDRHFDDLQWGHELYCAGHLIQAAVAHYRVTGGDELLTVARRVADHIDDVLGPSGKQGVGGHPGIETALVELHRCTGERRYLALAATFIDRRGHGLLGDGPYGREYWQDHVPVREATAVAGHAVRQLYLLAGVVDVYLETGERALLDAATRLWDDMVASRTYLTGGVGSHHRDEAFGDAYELPNERAYCETCAAIASVQLNWRLLLATGESRYADLIERTLFNGFLSGVSLSGDRYLYVNPLHVRDDHLVASGDQSSRRTAWFRCACCPPNVMRLLASLPHYVAATDADGLRVAQYATGVYGDGGRSIEVTTDYPWHGEVSIRVADSPAGPWRLVLRVPEWHTGMPSVTVNGRHADATAADGWLTIERAWQTGDTVRLALTITPRLTLPDPRVDASRGCAAIERGPLVYCLEGADHPGVRLDDLTIETAGALHDVPGPVALGGTVAVAATGRIRPRPTAKTWPYRSPAPAVPAAGRLAELMAVPYHAWANRDPGAMRVWIPVEERDSP